jgi:hypothetical protein
MAEWHEEQMKAEAELREIAKRGYKVRIENFK